MFAPKVAKPLTENTRTRHSSTRRSSNLTWNNLDGDHEQAPALDNTTARSVPRGVSWDFSTIPLFPPDLAGRPRRSSSADATLLAGAVQAKPIVGSVNDPLEYEADRVADQVVHMPDRSASVTSASRLISRKRADGVGENKLPENVDRTAKAVAADVPDALHKVLRSPGQPLDSGTRSFFEPHFGRNFNDVRVHSDSLAHHAAAGQLARAFTVGTHVVFGPGRYEPASDEGKHLLAHELTHVVQQAGSVTASVLPSQKISPAADLPRRPSAVVQMAPVGVQREPLSEEEIAKLPLDPLESRLTANGAEGSQWVLSNSALENLEAERRLLIKRRDELTRANLPGINAPPKNAEARWKEYRDELEHTWEVEAKYPDYGSHARKMTAVGTWRNYLKPEEIRPFLDKDPDFKELYYRWRDFQNKWAGVYEKEKNDESMSFYQGTPTDPLVMGYAGGEYPITVRASEFKEATEAAAIREVLQKIEGVKEGGAFATAGRGLGGLVGWALGRDVLKSSEIGATVGGVFDASLPVWAGRLASAKAWAGGGAPGSYSPDVKKKPPAVEYQRYGKPPITSPGDPAKVAGPPVRDRIPTPDSVRPSNTPPPAPGAQRQKIAVGGAAGRDKASMVGGTVPSPPARPASFTAAPKPRPQPIGDLLGSGPEAGAVNLTTPGRTGRSRQPLHHVYPQQYRAWFEARGFNGPRDIDNFCVQEGVGAHEGVHGGGSRALVDWTGPKVGAARIGVGGRIGVAVDWNTQVMVELTAAEDAKGSRLTFDEIRTRVETLMAKFKLKPPYFRYRR